MAGKHGGARPNTGGKRPGAGRKPKPTTVIAAEIAKIEQETGEQVFKAGEGEPLDPRPMLELIALGKFEVSPAQFKALVALLPYVHTKKGEGGKKEERQKDAKKVAEGRFKPTAAPLKLVGNA